MVMNKDVTQEPVLGPLLYLYYKTTTRMVAYKENARHWQVIK